MKLLNELLVVDTFLNSRLKSVRGLIDDEKKRIEESVLKNLKKE